ncbi:MAG: hypothetical protein MHM6MM_001879 [Cercozoa sp. M6MM]
MKFVFGVALYMLAIAAACFATQAASQQDLLQKLHPLKMQLQALLYDYTETSKMAQDLFNDARTLAQNSCSQESSCARAASILDQLSNTLAVQTHRYTTTEANVAEALREHAMVVQALGEASTKQALAGVRKRSEELSRQYSKLENEMTQFHREVDEYVHNFEFGKVERTLSTENVDIRPLVRIRRAVARLRTELGVAVSLLAFRAEEVRRDLERQVLSLPSGLSVELSAGADSQAELDKISSKVERKQGEIAARLDQFDQQIARAVQKGNIASLREDNVTQIESMWHTFDAETHASLENLQARFSES